MRARAWALERGSAASRENVTRLQFDLRSQFVELNYVFVCFEY